MLHVVGDVSRVGPATDFTTGEIIISQRTGQPIINLEVEGLGLLPDSSLQQNPDDLPALGRRVDVTVKVVGGRKDEDGKRQPPALIAIAWEYSNGHSVG